MNWSLIGLVTGACLLFTVWWQHGAIGDLKDDLDVAQKQVKDLTGKNNALFAHIQNLDALEKKLDEFDENQRKRTNALKGDLQKSMASDSCAPQPVPADTIRMQREDIQRANDESRAMFAP